jgi:hypothetical protein
MEFGIIKAMLTVEKRSDHKKIFLSSIFLSSECFCIRDTDRKMKFTSIFLNFIKESRGKPFCLNPLVFIYQLVV